MKIFPENSVSVRLALVTLSLVLQSNAAIADYKETSVQQDTPNLTESASDSLPARHLRMRQMFEQRARNNPQLKEGNNPRVQEAFAAIDPKKVKVQRDIAYGSAVRQDLDIYSPTSSRIPAPVLLFVHGGGWQVGNKTNGHIDKGVSWAEHGIVFVSINYRLAPEVKHPKQIEDVAQAFAWVHKHASEFGGDPARIFVMGHSAGAQLVDLLATNSKYLQEQGLKPGDIKGVISLDTASLNLQERLSEDTPEARMVGGMIKSAFGSDPAVLADASPTLAIKKGVFYPPFLMFCGEKRVSCCAQHQRFSAELKKVEGAITVKAVPLSHSDISKAAGQPDSEIFKMSLAFIQGNN